MNRWRFTPSTVSFSAVCLLFAGAIFFAPWEGLTAGFGRGNSFANYVRALGGIFGNSWARYIVVSAFIVLAVAVLYRGEKKL